MSIPKPQRRGEAGIALVLAIMALMLLTFLGLTLATTTSTELQIASNHRWALQAQYNAEAGIEVGKRILQGLNWSAVLPTARAAWDPTDTGTSMVPNVPFPGATRNFEMGNCDHRGDGAGYGLVLHDGARAYENVSDIAGMPGATLQGMVTIWVRRQIRGVGGAVPRYQDDANNEILILTAEGVAPGFNPALPNLARRVIEITARRSAGPGPCEMRGGQASGGPEGNNFYGACEGLKANAMSDITSGIAGADDGEMQGAAPLPPP